MTRISPISRHTRWLLLLLLCSSLTSGGCYTAYKVKKIKAHELTTMPSFTLPNTAGQDIAVGKPWGKATAVIMIRGFW